MTETQPDVAVAVLEGARRAFFDLLLAHWPRIAAAAWDGWQAGGRGTVTLEDGSEPPVIAYRSGAPCACHTDAVEAYDPETQVVVAVVRSDDREVVWIATLGGWPAPPFAAGTLPASALGVVLQ